MSGPSLEPKGWDSNPGIQVCMKGTWREHLLAVLLVPAVRKAGSRQLSLNSFRKASVTSYSVVKMGNQINVLSSEKKRKLHGSLYNKLKLFPCLPRAWLLHKYSNTVREHISSSSSHIPMALSAPEPTATLCCWQNESVGIRAEVFLQLEGVSPGRGECSAEKHADVCWVPLKTKQLVIPVLPIVALEPG